MPNFNPLRPKSFFVKAEDRLTGQTRNVVVGQNQIILTQEQAEVHVATMPGSLGGFHPGLTITPLDQAKFDAALGEWQKAHPERVAAFQKREEDHKQDVIAEQALRAQATAQPQA